MTETEPKQPTNYKFLIILAALIWLTLFVAFLRQAYIRISEDEGVTTQTASMQIEQLPRILK
jgi:hypothetical protein